MSSMDQAPRQQFLSSILLPEERTRVMGGVNVCKTVGQSGGPVLAGWLMGTGGGGGDGGDGGKGIGRGGWVKVFALAGGGKVVYDLGILWGFLGVRGREEEEGGRQREEGGGGRA